MHDRPDFCGLITAVNKYAVGGTALKQCPNCKNNLADYVPTCPHCGVNLVVTPLAGAQAAWTGPPETSGKATASLVCGILFFFWPAALAAVILGHLSLSEIKRSAGRLAGQGRAVAGLVLGYVGLAFIPFILIIAAIAIPNLLRSKMAANEASAVGSLRTYNTAMVTYATECPNIGYPKVLANLGPGVADGDKCEHANLLESRLSVPTPAKSGYRFYYMPEADANGVMTKYVLAADPINPGTTGIRHFFMDETGVIRYSMRGGADVNSEPLQ
jgi:type IV pilus assembly protein PilA